MLLRHGLRGAVRGASALRSLSSQAPEAVTYPGALRSFYTEELSFASNVPAIPTYRVMDRAGVPLADVPAEVRARRTGYALETDTRLCSSQRTSSSTCTARWCS